MTRFSSVTRVTFGLAMLSVTALLTADTLGLLPDARRATLHGRAALCESVAVQCTMVASSGGTRKIKWSLESLVKRNDDVLSAAFRSHSGELLVEVGDHAAHWIGASDQSTESQIFVPIFRGKNPLGTVELRFQPLYGTGWTRYFQHPLTQLILFTALMSFVVFYLYLRKMLQQLDPSQVIPDRVRSALDALAEGLIVVDRQERIVLANESFAKLVSRKPSQLQGRQINSFPWRTEDGQSELSPESRPWTRSIEEGAPKLGEMIRLSLSDSEELVLLTNATPVLGDDDNKCRGALISFDDVTPLKRKQAELLTALELLTESKEHIRRKNEELQILATRDPLTQCVNRRAFFEQFESQWKTAQRYGHPLSLVMVDIDHFKAFNDNHGHAFGDRVLKEVADVLKDNSRDADIVCRYGGEEFCVLLPHTELDQAKVAAESLRKAVAEHSLDSLSVTASLGVSAISLGAPNLQELLEQADKCLYVSKRNGRNCVSSWDDVPADLEVDESAVSRTEAPEEPSAAEEIPFQAVAALLSALNYRDASTAEHSRRVADLCVAVAGDRMSAADICVLENAALLHDIGKVGVPDAILLKPSALTDEEWTVMNAHTRIGAEIVQSAFSNDALAEIIKTHKAWWGGHPKNPGMPKGEAIPLGARVLALADAYDSMISDSTYRRGQSQEEAFAELRQCAGRQFDADLVEHFITVVQARGEGRVDGDAESSKRTPLQISMDIERLASALDEKDIDGVTVLTGRLKATALKYGESQIAAIAAELEKTIQFDPDLEHLIDSTQHLLELCQGNERREAEAAT